MATANRQNASWRLRLLLYFPAPSSMASSRLRQQQVAYLRKWLWGTNLTVLPSNGRGRLNMSCSQSSSSAVAALSARLQFWAGGRRADRAAPQVCAPWPMLAALVAVCALDLRGEVAGKDVPALAAVHHAS